MFAAAVGGYVIRAFVDGKVTFKDSLSISTLIDIFATLVIAGLIGYYLRERTDQKRREKDRLISRVEELIKLASAARDVVDRYVHDEVDLPELNKALKRLSNQTFRFGRKLETFGFSQALQPAFATVESALDKYRHYIGSEVSATKVGYGDSEEQRYFDALNDALDCVVRDINRLS